MPVAIGTNSRIRATMRTRVAAVDRAALIIGVALVAAKSNSQFHTTTISSRIAVVAATQASGTRMAVTEGSR